MSPTKPVDDRSIPRRRLLAMGLALPALVAAQEARASVETDIASRTARWRDLRLAIFGARPVGPGEEMVRIDAPIRALDAAVTPIDLFLPHPAGVAGLHLIIDDNPSPYAAHVRFGPALDPDHLSLRVRINGYTDLHAVAEMTDGQLLQAQRFIKATGGCSAPIGVSDDEAMAGMGEMKVKFPTPTSPESQPVILMIRHPNFSGLQMNQLTRLYTPARYLEKIQVSRGETAVFSLDGDISLSADPVIGFALRPKLGSGPLKVVATDSAGGHWEQLFDVPTSAA